MSTRLFHHPASTATITLTSAALLAGVLSGTAAADPPALNRDACVVAIAPAGVWPGTLDAAHHQYRLVSDAYDSRLSRQPACSPDLATR
ncbi:hypothetical protein [Blastococcus brunescens]|uniref:Uncharacterized protein n=1 Tax=Blastococcus brunescens TaxID=1564165 RepID=A0ABZ1AZN0_9ACTN|nr:hypothetical protein [Blastococcus sp. BMG 8361]WRL62956.1 hypothetical protein U6N30_24335 [Blastococcus sp. BMG 8361]